MSECKMRQFWQFWASGGCLLVPFLSNGVRLPKEVLAFASTVNGGRVQCGMWWLAFYTQHMKLERIQNTDSLTGHTLAPSTHVLFILMMHEQALNTLAQLPWKRLWQAGGYGEQRSEVAPPQTHLLNNKLPQCELVPGEKELHWCSVYSFEWRADRTNVSTGSLLTQWTTKTFKKKGGGHHCDHGITQSMNEQPQLFWHSAIRL